jgi:hypothetical protein
VVSPVCSRLVLANKKKKGKKKQRPAEDEEEDKFVFRAEEDEAEEIDTPTTSGRKSRLKKRPVAARVYEWVPSCGGVTCVLRDVSLLQVLQRDEPVAGEEGRQERFAARAAAAACHAHA